MDMYVCGEFPSAKVTVYPSHSPADLFRCFGDSKASTSMEQLRSSSTVPIGVHRVSTMTCDVTRSLFMLVSDMIFERH